MMLPARPLSSIMSTSVRMISPKTAKNATTIRKLMPARSRAPHDVFFMRFVREDIAATAAATYHFNRRGVDYAFSFSVSDVWRCLSERNLRSSLGSQRVVTCGESRIPRTQSMTPCGRSPLIVNWWLHAPTHTNAQRYIREDNVSLAVSWWPGWYTSDGPFGFILSTRQSTSICFAALWLTFNP